MSDPPHDLTPWDDAQRRGIALLGACLARLQPGMSNRDVRVLAGDLLAVHGFEGWGSPPDIRVGPRTRSGFLAGRLTPAVLLEDDLVTLALNPWSDRAMADVAATVHLGGVEPPLLDLARTCTRATCGYATRHKCVGELFVFARSWAANHRLSLVGRSVGHALLAPEGALAQGWPRSARLAAWLQHHQAHFLNSERVRGLWAIGPRLADASRGALFREVIVVRDDVHRVLGRDDLASVGTFEG
ncbi:MAG: M24 family metallopeptidase [Deltaproteobacteria bacterium]|nr:M24 family metallopeptidase [Deltaproteobacteria bacterium]